MALIACANCGHRVSTTALKCPRCGTPPQIRPAADNTENIIYCTKCGHPLSPLAEVCSACGVRRYSVAAPESGDSATADFASRSESQHSRSVAGTSSTTQPRVENGIERDAGIQPKRERDNPITSLAAATATVGLYRWFAGVIGFLLLATLSAYAPAAVGATSLTGWVALTGFWLATFLPAAQRRLGARGLALHRVRLTSAFGATAACLLTIIALVNTPGAPSSPPQSNPRNSDQESATPPGARAGMPTGTVHATRAAVWSMYLHDPAHTGRSQYATSANPGTLKWKFDTGGYVPSSPTIGADGTIYVGSYGSEAGDLHALNPDGSQKWKFATGNLNYGCSSAIGVDGTIYVAGGNGTLYAIKPDGTQKWTFTTGDVVDSSPAIGAEGTIYVGSGSNLYAVNPDGTQKWKFPTEGKIGFSSPAIGAEGTIYVGSGSNLYAVKPNGAQKWKFATDDNGISSPAIGADGTIYFGYEEYANVGGTLLPNALSGSPHIYVGGTFYTVHHLNALSPDGTLKWALATRSDSASSPAVGADGTIYVGYEDETFNVGGTLLPVSGHLYAINPGGMRKWALAIGGAMWSSPVIGADGTIYVGSDDDNLYAVNPDGTRKWAFLTEGKIGFSSPSDRCRRDRLRQLRWRPLCVGRHPLTPAATVPGSPPAARFVFTSFRKDRLTGLGSGA